MMLRPRIPRVKMLSVVVAALIVVSSVAVYMGFSMHDAPPPTIANGGVINIARYVNVALNVTVRNAQGQVIEARYLPHDLLLNNFYYMMLFPFLTSTYPSSWDLVNTAGTTKTFCYTGCADTLIGSGSGYSPIISIGSGTTAPAVTNYNLTTFVAQMPAVATPQTYYGTTYANTTISSTMTFATATTISEAGLIVHETNFYYMIAHDTFTTVNVPANGAITIAYTLGISDPNGVFTLNFENWVLSIFGAYTTCFGSTNCVSGYLYFEGETPSSSFLYLRYQTFSIMNTQFQIGVGTSSAAPVWTQNNLQAQIGSLVNIGTPSYVAGTNTVYFSASVSMQNSATITEAAFFGFAAYDGGTTNELIMLWRLTFNGVTIPAGGTATITFGYKV